MATADRDAFLTTRRLAQAEGILAGGSGGLAVHAALIAAAEVEDPEAMMVVILPDGGRSYISKIFSDAWMRQYGFLERDSDRKVGDVLARKREAGEMPTLVSVSTDYRVRDAVALLHVELLVGDQQALMVTREGHAEGLVTRTDLLEALVS